jgi:hypothetical protein
MQGQALKFFFQLPVNLYSVVHQMPFKNLYHTINADFF